MTTNDIANGDVSCAGPRRASIHGNFDEVDLAARLCARDKTAFRQIIERYAPRIFRVSYGILRDREAAEEIAREVFVKVYFSGKDFAGYSSLYESIHRITVSECYRFLRNSRLKAVCPGVTKANKPALPLRPIAAERAATDRAAMRRDFINELLSEAPEDDRWLLISKDVEGCSLADLSQMTGQNENTIRIRLLGIRQGLAAAEARMRSGHGNEPELRWQHARSG